MGANFCRREDSPVVKAKPEDEEAKMETREIGPCPLKPRLPGPLLLLHRQLQVQRRDHPLRLCTKQMQMLRCHDNLRRAHRPDRQGLHRLDRRRNGPFRATRPRWMRRPRR